MQGVILLVQVAAPDPSLQPGLPAHWGHLLMASRGQLLGYYLGDPVTRHLRASASLWIVRL